MRNKVVHSRNGPGEQMGPALAEAFFDLQADYAAARESKFRARLTGVQPGGSGADYHYRNDQHLLAMIERSRDLDRNSPIIGQGITRLIVNCLQDGLRPAPKTGSEALDAGIKERWLAWSTDPELCDRSGEMNLTQIAELAFRAMIVDGDISVLMTADGSLEAMEGHRMRSPKTTRNVVHGVQLDKYRRHERYFYMKENIGPTFKAGLLVRDFTEIPVRDEAGRRQVIFLRHPKRFSQTRGVGALLPIMDTAGHHDDLQFATLVKQQASACWVMWEQRDVESEPPMDDDGSAMGEQREEGLADNTSQTIDGLAPGLMLRPPPGVKLQGYTPNIPSPEFFPHAMMVLTFIAINLGLPVHVLLLDPSRTNFSGWRGAIDQARLGFKSLQRILAAQFYRPIYLWQLRRWLVNDESFRNLAGYRIVGGELEKTDEGLNVWKNEFSLPHFPYIDPKSDVKADAQTASSGLNSRRRLLLRRGLDITEVDSERVTDEGALIRAAVLETALINAALPEANLNWRELLHWTVPKSGTPPNAQQTPRTEASATAPPASIISDLGGQPRVGTIGRKRRT